MSKASIVPGLALASLMALAFAAPAVAEEAPRPKPCREDPVFRQFDFWLGTWAVHDRASGERAGTNRIEATHEGCLVLERWESVRGSRGTSMNHYDAVTGTWRQLWVANGYSIDIAGGLDAAGAMVLVGEIHDYREKNSAPFRGTWTRVSDDEVRQLFEQQDPESGAWSVWFDGRYLREKKGAAD